MTTRDRWLLWAAAVMALGLGAGCKPEIGDDCSVSTDCSAIGDRLCDTTQPGGYCTIFNCEPGTCPEEAICVGFQSSPSAAGACANPQDTPRFQRTFCMRRCDGNGDCRSGYQCIDMGTPNGLSAIVYENGPTNGKVCSVPPSALPVADDAGTAVCHDGDGGVDGVAPPLPDAGSDMDAAADADAAPIVDAALDAPGD